MAFNVNYKPSYPTSPADATYGGQFVDTAPRSLGAMAVCPSGERAVVVNGMIQCQGFKGLGAITSSPWLMFALGTLAGAGAVYFMKRR